MKPEPFKPELYVIGTSMGGVQAIQDLFRGLRAGFRTPVVVVMHVPHSATISFELIFSMFPGKVEEVRDKTRLEPGHAYFAPPDYHVLVEKDGTLSLSQDDEVCFARPSIDVLFESAAVAMGPRVRGVLLTGANADGARGLLQIREAGGQAWVQDPAEAIATAMPEAALRLLKPDRIGGIGALAAAMMEGEGQA